MKEMNAGFTLVEIMVVMLIISIISALLAVAYPNVRDGQKLTLTEQQFQALLREAQQRAINEKRETNCTSTVTNPLTQKHCSNIGLFLDDTSREFILFADVNRPDDNQWEPSGDSIIKRLSFSDGVTFDGATSSAALFLFEATPPTVTLFSGVNKVTLPEKVVFVAGDSSISLKVQSYGQVERE